MKIYEVIMAGGGGTRFWPLSRKTRPKQLINISGRDIMLNETIKRLDPLVDRENVYIVTNEAQQALMKELIVGGVPFRNILVEPAARNTAPCVLYAAAILEKEHGEGVMCVFPSDHHIGMPEEYRCVIAKAAEVAQKSDCIVTIGIKPTFPSTGYGYISRGEIKEEGVWEVERFVEKPDADTAQTYIDSGRFSWNSGVFIFKISTILEAFQKYLPDMVADMDRIMASRQTPEEEVVLKEIYPKLQSISIDYGIMEKADNVVVMEGDYGWSDVGSYDALDTVYTPDENQNISVGDNLLIDSTGCIVMGKDKLITLIGVEDLVVVEAEDAILVCKKEAAQDAKRAVEALKEQGREEYL